MSEKIRTVGELKPTQAERFAFFCSILGNCKAKAGPDFNSFVNNSDPAEIIRATELLLEDETFDPERDVFIERAVLVRILNIAKDHINNE